MRSPLKYTADGSPTPEYRTWNAIKNRCSSPTNKDYYKYGGRGIRVCTRWISSFEDFLSDMGRRPTPQHSIDRMDNSGPYSPDNCRWATAVEQNRNTRTNRILEYAGLSLSVAEWAEGLGMTPNTLHSRISKGWSVEDILTKPLGFNVWPSRKYGHLIQVE